MTSFQGLSLASDSGQMSDTESDLSALLLVVQDICPVVFLENRTCPTEIVLARTSQSMFMSVCACAICRLAELRERDPSEHLHRPECVSTGDR